MSLRILQTGLLTTFQDMGRKGYRHLGINPNGVMDTTAATLVNYLVGNEAEEGVLELHFPMGELELEESALIAFGGGDFYLTADGEPLENWRTYVVYKGTRIRSVGKPAGTRLYIAVHGGFELEKWLGSTSTHLKAHVGGYQGRTLQKGDRVPFKKTQPVHNFPQSIHSFPWKIAANTIQQLYPITSIQLIPGPEWNILTSKAKSILQSKDFIVTAFSDRMGYRIEGESLDRQSNTELISSAVTKGTVQLLPNGQLIILMADHQTTGGYPRIATVSGVDLSALAQHTSQDILQFRLISVDEAEKILLAQHKGLKILKFIIFNKLKNYLRII